MRFREKSRSNKFGKKAFNIDKTMIVDQRNMTNNIKTSFMSDMYINTNIT